MSTKDNEWTIVAGPASPEVAAKQFDEWRRANREWADRLSGDEILVDFIRGLEGGPRRYRVKRLPRPK